MGKTRVNTPAENGLIPIPPELKLFATPADYTVGVLLAPQQPMYTSERRGGRLGTPVGGCINSPASYHGAGWESLWRELTLSQGRLPYGEAQKAFGRRTDAHGVCVARKRR